MPWIFNPFTARLDYYQASSGNLTTDVFTTTGGSQTLTLSNTPVAVLLVILNDQVISLAAGDYSVVGSTVNLLNPDIPAGLDCRVLYNY